MVRTALNRTSIIYGPRSHEMVNGSRQTRGPVALFIGVSDIEITRCYFLRPLPVLQRVGVLSWWQAWAPS